MGYLTEATIGGSDYKLAGALYGTCATGAATAAKVVTLAAFDSLETGVTIQVKFTYSNTASNATLNVNSTGAKNLCCYGTTRVGTTTKTSWEAGAVVSFTYDGTSWVMNDYIADTGVTTDTKNTAGTDSTNAKIYLIGAKAISSPENYATTYSNSKVYATDGALVATTFNGYTLADAAAKGVDTSVASGSTSTNLPTTAAIVSYVDSAISIASSGALTYKGVATALTDITGTSYKQGWYWMVGSNPDITIDGQTCEPGDMIIAKQDKTATADNDLDVIQTNIETLTTTEIDTLWAAA